MKRSLTMNFWKVNASIACTIVILALSSLPVALAQDEPADTTAPAAPEPGAAAEPSAMEPQPAAAEPATTLERVRERGKLTLGYRTDAQPFSYRDEAGQAAGYSVVLCGNIAEMVKAKLGLPALAVEWIPVTMDTRFTDVRDGKVDLLCGADTATLTRRQDVAFSIPIFPGGIGAVIRTDAPSRLKLLLEGKPLAHQPFWRGYPAQVLHHKTFTAVAGTTTEPWLAGRITKLGILATASTVETYDAGIGQVLARSSDALFGDRAILLDAARRSQSADELVVLDRLFTVEPIALALARGDEDFRLLVDRTLSELYATEGFIQIYLETFGEPDETDLLFFRTSALPE